MLEQISIVGNCVIFTIHEISSLKIGYTHSGFVPEQARSIKKCEKDSTSFYVGNMQLHALGMLQKEQPFMR